MSKLEVDKIDPQSGTNLELGTSGDTITIPTGVTLDASNATTTLPSNIVTTDGTQTLTNKSIATSQLTGTITPSDGTVTNAKIVDSTIQLAKLSATGTKDATTFLRGDNTFATVSSDYVLLATTTASSVASVSFDGHFSATYKNYQIIISDLLPATNGERLRLRYLVSSAEETSSNYGYMIGDMLAHSSGDSSSSTEQNAITQNYMLITSEMSNTSTLTNSVYMTLFNPLSSTQNKAMFWQNQNRGSVLTRLLRCYVGTGVYEANTSALSGIKFYMSSGNLSGNFKLYGLK